MTDASFALPRQSLIVVLLLLAIATTSLSCRSTPENDFHEFRCLLTGQWDNLNQAKVDIERNLDAADRHPRRAMTYVPVRNSNIEGQLFAILNYTDEGFSGDVSRVALHRFRPGSDGKIIHEFMFPRDRAALGDLVNDLTPLTKLTEADVTINALCAMTWQKVGDHYEGSTTQGQCVTSSFTDTPILIEGHGELFTDLLLRHDQNFDLDGNALPVAGGGLPERFDKQKGLAALPPGLATRLESIVGRPTLACLH